MNYPKLPPWPFIDPQSPPSEYLKVEESLDRARSNYSPQLWHFFVNQSHLVIVKKEWIQFDDGEPGEYAIRQYEYPIAGARWFVETVERFFLPPDHPNAVPRDKFYVRGEVGGETLGVTRGAWFGGEHIPGYSFDNINRIEHSTVLPEGATCQMFKMGDPWLFDDGLFDLFKEIAQRHENGEF